MVGPDRREQKVTPFPEAALTEAHSVRVSRDLMQGRNATPGITLGTGRRQAFWVEKVGDTHLVSVSYPHVAAVVPRSSALDQEAYRRVIARGNATEVTPLFPGALTNGIFDLRKGEPRPTLTVTIPLDKDLIPGEPEVDTTMVSASKNTTGLVMAQALLDARHPEHNFFSEYKSLALDLLKKRRERGALAFYDLTQGVATTTEGRLRRVRTGEVEIAEIVRQEFLILAGQSVAEILLDNEYPTLFLNHKAKPQAPSHASLIQDIRMAIAYPEALDPSLYERRRRAILEKPTYSPFLEGHFGLNATAYVEISSPVTSYPALVGQRILSDFHADEEPQFSVAELKNMGEYFGATMESIEGTTTVPQRERIEVGAQLGIPAMLAAADGEAFRKIVERAVKEPTIRPELAAEITKRREDGRLGDNDILTILAQPEGDVDFWKEVQTDLIRDMVATPGLIRRIANIGTQRLGWERVEKRRKTVSSGPSSARVFTFTAELATPDGSFLSEPISSDSPLLAKQYAELDVMAKVLKLEIPDIEEPPTTGQTMTPGIEIIVDKRQFTEREDPSLHYAGELHEKIKSKGKSNYKVTTHGKIHNPYYKGSVTVTLNDTKYVSDEVIGRTNADAKQSAAANVLEKIKAQANERVVTKALGKDGASVKPITITNGDYKGGLNSLATRNKWEKPKYSNVPTGDGGYAVTITIPIPKGDPLEHTEHVVDVETGKAAAQVASANMLREIFSGEIIER